MFTTKKIILRGLDEGIQSKGYIVSFL